MGLSSDQTFYLILAVIAGLVVSSWVFIEHLSVVSKAKAKTRQTEAREESRREIAAYVAEGSISADDAAKLMAASPERFTVGVGGLKDTIRDCLQATKEARRESGDARAGAKDSVRRAWGFGASADEGADRCERA